MISIVPDFRFETGGFGTSEIQGGAIKNGQQMLAVLKVWQECL